MTRPFSHLRFQRQVDSFYSVWSEDTLLGAVDRSGAKWAPGGKWAWRLYGAQPTPWKEGYATRKEAMEALLRCWKATYEPR